MGKQYVCDFTRLFSPRAIVQGGARLRASVPVGEL